MGIVTVTCALDRQDLEISAAVGGWIEAFYHGIAVRTEPDHVILESARFAERRLRSIWQVALLNERLVAAGRAHRADVIAELVA